MVNTNRFPGLARGPMDHKSSSVINMISDGTIDMGSVVIQNGAFFGSFSETIHRVQEANLQGDNRMYGIAVGGDGDGIYGDGSASTDDSTRATTGSGQGVVVVTQGRCLARVSGAILIGDRLTQSATLGVLELGLSDDSIIAVALQDVASPDTDMIAVDVQREGNTP